MGKTLKVGACQTLEFIGDMEATLAWIERSACSAEAKDVDLLLFPECFLQGYIVDKSHFNRYALDLDSAEFRLVLQRLVRVKPILVFGLIELKRGRFFNSAVVVDAGELLGVYQKTHLLPGEVLFEAGTAYPVFECKGVKFGINICYDTNFAEAAAALAAQGARLLLVPAQNMMRRQKAEKYKYLHNEVRAERVKETGMWLISADVTGERDGLRIAYGPTSIMNPRAEVVAQVPLLETGMVTAEVEVE